MLAGRRKHPIVAAKRPIRRGTRRRVQGNDAGTREPTPARGNRKESTSRCSSKKVSSVRNTTQRSSPSRATITNDTIRKEDVHKNINRVLCSRDEIESDYCLSTDEHVMHDSVRSPHVVAAAA